MGHKFYSAEDFIQDEYFQQWVFTPDESSDHFWENFLLENPAQQKNVEEAREFLQTMKFGRPAPESLIQKIKSDFNAAIDALESSKRAVQLDSAHKTGRWFYLVAASVAIALCVSYVYLSSDLRHVLLHAWMMEEQRTPRGKQRHIVLEDGTNVWLNANSSLKYARNFWEKGTREVSLAGEAYFDVAENAEKPFIVRTSGIAIKVLGTAFNVRSYAGDNIVETTLIRGKVTIASDTEDSVNITLLPHQQAIFSTRSRKIELKETVNTEDHIAWKNGWMVFDDKPFSYIKETLERWYDVTIILEDENSLSCSFSGKFKGKTLEEVLEIFRNTEAIHYRIDGSRVFISGKLCKYEESNQ